MMGNIEELINKLAQDTGTVKAAPHPYMLSLQWMGWAAAYLVVSLMFSGLRPDPGDQAPRAVVRG